VEVLFSCHFITKWGTSVLRVSKMQESCLQLSLGVPGELLALLEIAFYVEPRSAALPTQAFTFEKLRGAINHSISL
jgi:hypothetical protein